MRAAHFAVEVNEPEEGPLGRVTLLECRKRPEHEYPHRRFEDLSCRFFALTHTNPSQPNAPRVAPRESG
jgi:hypothetical protein